MVKNRANNVYFSESSRGSLGTRRGPPLVGPRTPVWKPLAYYSERLNVSENRRTSHFHSQPGRDWRAVPVARLVFIPWFTTFIWSAQNGVVSFVAAPAAAAASISDQSSTSQQHLEWNGMEWMNRSLTFKHRSVGHFPVRTGTFPANPKADFFLACFRMSYTSLGAETNITSPVVKLRRSVLTARRRDKFGKSVYASEHSSRICDFRL